MSALSKNIGPSDKRPPSKKEVNFIQKEKTKFLTPGKVVIIICLIALFGVGVYTGVIKRYSDVASLSRELSAKEDELKEIQAVNATYAEVEEEYFRYGTEYMSDTEKQYLNRVRSLDIIEECVMPYAAVTNIDIIGNSASIDMIGITLDDAAKIQNYVYNTGGDDIESVYINYADYGGTVATDGSIIPTITMQINYSDQTTIQYQGSEEELLNSIEEE